MQYENYIDINSKKLEYFKELKELLQIENKKDYNLICIGTPNGDGGYFMIDDFNKGNIAYSFGINNNADWENDIANLGYQVFMYDHTVEKSPLENKNFHFFKNGISAIDADNSPLKSLKYYILQNRHDTEQNMLLKLDVEGYEWGVLDTIEQIILKQFNQIVIEFHNILGGNEKILNVFRKLNQTHKLVYLNANPLGISAKIGEDTFHNIIEVTYLKK